MDQDICVTTLKAIFVIAGALQIVPLADGNGPNRKRLLELVGEQSSELALKATKTIYVIDDPVELSMLAEPL